MCVKLVTDNSVVPYDIGTPLDMQLKGLKKVVIDYMPMDKSVAKFIQELDRFSKVGINFSFSVEVNHNNNLEGFRAKRKITKLENDITLNEIIKLMSLSHACADQKLEAMVNLCVNKECDVKQKA